VQSAGEFYTAATWSLARPLANDAVVIELNCDAPDGVHVRNSQIFVDGDYDNVSGGTYRKRVYSLPGDAAPDGRVNAIDLAGVRRGVGGSTGDMIYSAWYDVDASGRINALDLAAVRQRFGTRVPTGEPAAVAGTASPSSLSALASSPTKELFASQPILA
jgi:hypothetical protein